MTFDSNMQATEQDAIPELYRIIGGGYEWKYTSHRTNLTFLGETYVAASIKRSAFTNTKQIGDSKVTITFPLSQPLLKYISAYPLPSTTIQVYRAVYSDLSQYALLFEGKVKRASFNNKVISAECGIDDEMASMLPHIVYQSYCNWQVFDCNCGLAAADYDVSAVVTVRDSSLISTTFGTYAAGHFTQGWVKFGGDMRFITNHAGSTIDLQLPFASELVTGSTVYAYPGCDGAPATCISKYNNWLRWLGMPYIPSHNPVVWGFK
jgi:uncharacterized phage protein (TIGR02218 family)